MKVDYTNRAVADLLSITAYYEGVGSPGVGARIAAQIDEVVERIAAWPESGKLVMKGQGLRVIPLRRYPYLIFYEIFEPETVRVLHIRHTSRRPWARQ
jgi:plasmid stabilization system protein ParE